MLTMLKNIFKKKQKPRRINLGLYTYDVADQNKIIGFVSLELIEKETVKAGK